MNMNGTMYKISCAKWSGWRAPVVVLLCFVAAVTAQPGFLNIDCGGKTHDSLPNWVSDADYIDHLGEKAYLPGQMGLRFFPKPLNKSCYHLPVDPDVPYLLRLFFAVGTYNYSGIQQMPSFAVSFETMGTLYTRNITIANRDSFYFETILASSGKMLYICLIRTLESVDPFISVIESRKLQDGMYGQVKPGTILENVCRIDVGGGNETRYPPDKFDRVWQPNGPDVGIADVVSSSTSNVSNIDDTEDFPPPRVMQTAWILKSSVPEKFFLEGGRKSLLLLYFAETQILNMSESRSFYVTINGEKKSETITLPRNHSAVQLTIPSNQTDDIQFSLVSTSSLPPIINAYEYYAVFDTQPATYLQDMEALDGIKEMFNMTSWISDPCFVIPWNGISCHKNPSPIRISEITLSRRNLTGLVPQQIGQLTALVNMALDHNHLTGPLPDFSNLMMLERLDLQNNNLNSRVPDWLSELKNLRELSLDNNHLTGPLPDFSNLTMLERLHLQSNNLNNRIPDWLSELKNLKELSLDDNHLTGPLPDFSNLTMLERLHLQNNNLNGRIPDWLSELKNLKELFIDNNNFSGEIPTRLLQKPSLNLQFSGNPYLSIPMEHKKLRGPLILGMTLSGVLIISLLLMVGIVLYRKNKECVTTESNEVEIAVYSTSNEWTNATIMAPNSAYAFTLDQMMAATQQFSESIGKGGFGSVFFGKFPEGKNIAVKVLSLFSTQGVDQFQNEIDVLSRVHHENLVTLLGYCNECKKVMIIYEHMPGGSLKDRLYGPGGSELNWKTRVKIALDAAQGLEYMHIVCTPKIIHRDVKTSNILLDNNLKGKLGDFGLSKIWIDGEASHVTTMVKGTTGYLDPEYFSTERLTEKSDVYSFGVVLLGLICGRKPIDDKLSEDKLNIIQWATPFVEMDAIPRKIEEIIDKRLGGNYDIKSITLVAKVAIRCVKDESFYRPSMSEVVAELRDALKLEESCSTISNVLP